jgi:hypothetical protein
MSTLRTYAYRLTLFAALALAALPAGGWKWGK